MSKRIPEPECLDEFALALVKIVAKTSYLPHPETVRALNGPAFPTVRCTAANKRLSVLEENGVVVGIYDDNATPAWALFWSHDLEGTRQSGWNVAHVWHAASDRCCYTHLANLALVPECLESLTNKAGPLTQFLRWHAWSVYGWKPSTIAEPGKPAGFDEITWRYFRPCEDPAGAIQARIDKYENQRLRLLRPLMQRIPVA